MELIRPAWTLSGVQAFSTTRVGGVSQGPRASLNLGMRCDDDPATVAENRRRLRALLPSDPLWLKQVHGHCVTHAQDWHADIAVDAIWTDRPGQVLAVLTADCLPLLLVDAQEELIGAAHAGWRGLAADIPGHLVRAMAVRPADLTAWIGPGIGAGRYEVGESVLKAFQAQGLDVDRAFDTGDSGRLHCNLKDIARQLLSRAGVAAIIDSGLCTATEPDRFFSYRRDGQTGRMATMIWRP